MLDKLQAMLGPKGFTHDRDAMAPWLSDWRGRFHGDAAALLSPATTAEVARRQPDGTWRYLIDNPDGAVLAGEA